MRKKYVFIVLASGILLIALAFAAMFSKASNVEAGIVFVGRHTIVGPIILILWRVFGIIVPAIPAGVISFAAVPIFGWLHTYIYTLSGILAGTSLAFFLARIFREKLVARFMPLQKIHKLESEMSKKKEFFAIVALRLFTAPVMDFSSYIAGLTKISYKKFLLATLVASLPDIFIFYIGEETYKRFFGKSIFIAVIVLFVIALTYFIYKKYNHSEGKNDY